MPKRIKLSADHHYWMLLHFYGKTHSILLNEIEKKQFAMKLRWCQIISLSIFILICKSAVADSPMDFLYQPGKIIIGDDINYPPYSFLDEDGNPSGFNIDIARAVGNAMGLEIEIRLDSWDVIRPALEAGEIDAISGMFFSEERAKIYGYSSRHSVSTGDIFTRRNIHISTLEELKGKKVAVQTADIIAEYLAIHHQGIELVEVSTVKEALTLVNNGTLDFAALLKLPGLYSIRENNLRNVKPANVRFLPRDYCMVVLKENESLLYILNAGLHIIKADDQYQQIHDRWLGVYEEKTLASFLIRNRIAFLVTGSVFFTLLLFSISQKYLVNKKTRELLLLNENLRQSNHEIQKKNQLLAHSQDELKLQLKKIQEQGEIIQFKQNFLANMSHEIRTPLSGVIGIIDILGQTSLSRDQAEYIHILKNSGENLREIINQVLDYSKIEAGRLQLNKKAFRFSQLKEFAHNMFQGLLCNKLVFESSIAPDVPEYIEADKSRIQQIINNLVSNAIKFTREGKIQFKAERLTERDTGDEICIRISIRDTGIGISEEQQKVLFKPFAQIHQSDFREYEGTGLGLSISKELATLHGGEIGVESKSDEGSNFWFTFLAREVSRRDLTCSNQTESLSPKQKLNILLVEDKEINQKVISLLLEGSGHSVRIASNGAVAIDIYQPGLFDLILMDIQMPVMDGITATRLLKEKYSELPPVVGLSANAFEGDREKYMNLGLDEYLTKPLKKQDFQLVIQKISSSTKNPPR